MSGIGRLIMELSRIWQETDHTNDPDRIRENARRIIEKEKEIKLSIKQSKQQSNDSSRSK